MRAKFLQSFRLSGGPNARIIRGEEVVQMTVIDSCRFGSMYERAEKVRQTDASEAAAAQWARTNPSPALRRNKSDATGAGRKVTFSRDEK